MSTPNRIPVRPWVVCMACGILAGFVYLVVTWLLLPGAINRSHSHKIGSGTNTQEWLYALSDYILGFPFDRTVLNSLCF